MGADINIHDQWACESMGSVQDRTKEHLGQSDKAISAYRRMLRAAIEQAGKGERPLMVLEPQQAPAITGPVCVDGVGPATDWQGYYRDGARASPQDQELGERALAFFVVAHAIWHASSPRKRGPIFRTGGYRSPPSRGRQIMMSSRDRASLSFVERHNLWSDEQYRLAAAVEKEIEERQLELVRFSFADQHGVLRGKTLVAAEAAKLMRNGVSMTTTLLAKDTSHRTVFPVFTPGGGFAMPEMQGAADFLMIADPSTFRVLPWAPNTGWVLCDMYFPNGKPVPFSTRQALPRPARVACAQAGFDMMAGLEVEFHLYRDRESAARACRRDMAGRADRGELYPSGLPASDRGAVGPDRAGA